MPFGAIILELILYRLLRALDAVLGLQIHRFTASGGQAMLQTVTTMTLSFIVFTFGSLLVAIQVASGQLTPRVIATTLLRDNVVRYSVGLFVFSLLFAISIQNRIEGTRDQLVLVVAGVLGLLSTAAFLYLIDYAARLLRPIGVLSRLDENGLSVIGAVYPQPWDALPDRSSCRQDRSHPVCEHREAFGGIAESECRRGTHSRCWRLRRQGRTTVCIVRQRFWHRRKYAAFFCQFWN
jgi:uncharacterized membrane protein